MFNYVFIIRSPTENHSRFQLLQFQIYKSLDLHVMPKIYTCRKLHVYTEQLCLLLCYVTICRWGRTKLCSHWDWHTSWQSSTRTPLSLLGSVVDSIRMQLPPGKIHFSKRTMKYKMQYHETLSRGAMGVILFKAFEMFWKNIMYI